MGNTPSVLYTELYKYKFETNKIATPWKQSRPGEALQDQNQMKQRIIKKLVKIISLDLGTYESVFLSLYT